MKVYIPCFGEDAHDMGNPFVYTISDSIQKYHKDSEFCFSPGFLWKPECDNVDVVHFMWPQIHAAEIMKGQDLDKRIASLKSKGVKIVATCHNLQPHYGDKVSNETYNIVYSNCDVIIHLGEYSKAIHEKEYPNAKHVLIQHHVYNTIYDQPKDRTQARQSLGIAPETKVAVCIGDFRADEERRMIVDAARELHKDGVIVIAPRLYTLPRLIARNPLRMIYYWFRYPIVRNQIKEASQNGLMVKGRFINDEEMLIYLGAADIVLIQRLHILNSGNLPLGMYMSKVVVGPDDGNVGQILKSTNNPIFNPHDIHSVVDAIKRGFELAEQGKGNENKDWIMQNCTTEVIAEEHWQLYNSIVE